MPPKDRGASRTTSLLTNADWRKNADHYKQKLIDFLEDVKKNDPRARVTGGYIRDNCIDLAMFSAKDLNNKLVQARSRQSSILNNSGYVSDVYANVSLL
jgi:hypothetical protein